MTSADRLLPVWLTGGAIAIAFAAFTGLESIRSLRWDRESKARRLARNLTIAGMGAIVVSLSEQPLALLVGRHGEAHQWGLLRALPIAPLPKAVLAIALLDYTLYVWHVLTHKAPLLWRFHLPHHIDLDCDASTALRFHFGELLFSAPFRALQMILIGASVREYSIWQTLLFVSILFHHSNFDLSPEWDRRLSWLVVTPRMHGIHHDAKLEHADSNWSSGLSVWDRLHGTLRLDIPQQEVTIGVPAYQDPQDVTLRNTVLLPFAGRGNDWKPRGPELPR